MLNHTEYNGKSLSDLDKTYQLYKYMTYTLTHCKVIARKTEIIR